MSGRRKIDWALAASLYETDLTLAQIAAQVGAASAASLASAIRHKRRVGEWTARRQSHDKKDWAQIERDLLAGLSTREIARKHGFRSGRILTAALSVRRARGHFAPRLAPGRNRKRGPYRDSAARRERFLAIRNADNAAATEAAKRSPLAGRSPRNVHALDWHLIAPDGTHHHCRNLYHFVREHPHLFAAADRAWKRTGGKRGTGGEWCNATAGLLNVRAGKSRAWKGWQVIA
jgi:hypothetical protein